MADDLDLDKAAPVDSATGASGDAPQVLPEIIPDAGGVTLADIVDTAPAGEIILNKDGSVRKKPGRKPGQKNATPAPGTVTDAPVNTGSGPKTPAERKAQRVASEELARAVLGTAVGSMVALVGPEWDFQSQQEADGMKAAVAAYIESKGDGQLTPESMLLLVSLGYALPRAAHENTRSKFGAFFGKLWEGFRAIFSR